MLFLAESKENRHHILTVTLFSMSSVFGLVFAGLFLYERISLFQIIVIMLTGIYLINRKESMKHIESTSFGFQVYKVNRKNHCLQVS